MKILISILTLGFLLLMGGCRATVADIPDISVTDRAEPTPTSPATAELTMEILKRITDYKKTNATIDARQLAEYANSILPQLGYDYYLDVEKLAARKIKEKKTRPAKVAGDSLPYVQFDIDVTTTDGKRKSISVTAPEGGSCCCGYYYAPIAVTKITAKELTVVIDGKETVIARPAEIPVVQEYIFGKEEPKPLELRSWEVPTETYPYGISKDGLKLYVKTEIDELLLEISDTGNIRFVSKDAEGIITNHEDLRKLPPPKTGEILQKSGDLGLYRYIVNGVPHVLEFPYPCT